MFWDVMNICKTAIIAVGSWTWTIFDTIGAVGCIVAFSIIGLFVSFIVLHKSDAVTVGSDLVASAKVDKARRYKEAWEQSQWQTNEDWINHEGW